MGESFKIENAIPLARDILSTVWNRKPLYIRGSTDIFFYGCPCGAKGNVADLRFRLNLTVHREHVIQEVEKTYGVLLSQEALENGSGKIGGLASHVQGLLEAPRTLERKAKDEAEASRLRRLQDRARDLADDPGLGDL